MQFIKNNKLYDTDTAELIETKYEYINQPYIAYIHNPNTGQKKRALIEDGVYLNSINNPTDEDIEYILKKCSVTDLTVFLNKCEDDLKEEK